MAEYIEREAAIKSLLNDSPEQVGYSREDAADCIRYMDAADVATVRHRRWIPAVHVGDCCYRCSECQFLRDTYLLDIGNYCPNCGAKMDGGADNEP